MHVINYIISYEEEYACTSYEEEDAWGHVVTSKGCPSLSFSSYTNSLGGQSETHMIHTSFKKTSFWSCSPYIHTHAHTHTHTNAHTHDPRVIKNRHLGSLSLSLSCVFVCISLSRSLSRMCVCVYLCTYIHIPVLQRQS